MIYTGNDIINIIGNTLQSPDSYLSEVRGDAEQAIDFYNNVQRLHMDAEYKRTFANWDDNRDLIPLRILPLTQKIIDTLSLLYKKSPTRSIYVGDKADQKLTDMYNKLCDEGKKGIRLRTVDRYTRLCNTTLLKVHWDNGLQYRIFTPGTLGVVAEALDPQKAAACVYEATIPDNFGTPDDEELITYIYWDEDNHYTVDDRGELINIQTDPESVPTTVNPYKVLPFATFRNNDHIGNEFWAPIDQTWVNANTAVNMAMTDLFHLLKEQGWAQPVFEGNISGSDNLTRDPTRWMVTKGAKVYFANPDAPIDQIVECLTWFLRTFLFLKDLGWNTLQGQSHLASGLSILASRLDLLEDRQDRLDMFTQSEKDLFEIEKAIINYHAAEKGLPQIPDDAELRIDWPDIDSPIDRDEEIKYDEHRIKYNLMSLAQILREKNPDIDSEDEAVEIIRKNKEINDSLKNKFVLGKAPVQKDSEAETETDEGDNGSPATDQENTGEEPKQV